jgi:tetratricopeptide (TPR) repeat protein
LTRWRKGPGRWRWRSVSLLRSCDDPAELADALGVLGNVLRKHGQATQARPILEESVALARQSSNPLCLAGALHNLGQTLGAFDRNKSVQLFHESLSIHREHSYLPGLAHNLNNLGASAYFAGDYVNARQWFLESQAAFEELGDPGRVAMTMNNLGEACRQMGEYAACAHYLGEVLRRCQAAGSGRLHSNVLTGLAQLAKAQAQYRRAYELAAFVHRWPMTEQSVYDETCILLEELASHLSPQEAAAAEARAQTWTLDDAVAEALVVE